MLKFSLVAVALGGAAFLLPFPDVSHSQPRQQDPMAKDAMTTDVTGQSRAYLHNYNLPAQGVAIEGYSPVSYLEHGRADRGDPRFSVTHNGVTYYLASAKQVGIFKQNPKKYIPAFGGWCAFGMTVQDKFPVDPLNFKILNGRVFLFLSNKNVDALELWSKGNQAELLRKAQAHWSKVNG